MEKAQVYFTDFRCRPGKNNLQKLQKLCKKAGIEQINFEGKFVAIKMHFGELGCLASLRPQYVKAVADLVKELGGRPFLTDCNTLIRAVENIPWNTWTVLTSMAITRLRQAVRLSSATACEEPMKSKCRSRMANTLKKRKSAGPLWMRTSSSAWLTSKATK